MLSHARLCPAVHQTDGLPVQPAEKQRNYSLHSDGFLNSNMPHPWQGPALAPSYKALLLVSATLPFRTELPARTVLRPGRACQSVLPLQ